MTNRVQTQRFTAAGARPTGRPPGELYANFADGQLGVVTPVSNQDLIAVRFFSTTANYAVGDHVVQDGNLYRAIAAVTVGPFNPAQWSSATSNLYLPLTGGTLTGPLYLDTVDTPTDDSAAASQAYVKAQQSSYLPLAGGQLSGVVIAPTYENTSQSIIQSGGVLQLDLRLGQNVDVTLTGNITLIVVLGWPTVIGVGSKVRIKFVNPSTFTVTGWPTGTIWPNNTAPTISPNGTDIIELASNNGGATIYGSIVGQAYASVITAIDGAGGQGARGNGTGNTVSATITTTRTNDIILALIHAEASGGGQSVVSTLTGGGLTWTRRKQLFFADTYNATLELWWAPAAVVLNAQTVTATITGGQAQFDAASIQLIAVSGVASLVTPFDVNAALPAVQTRPYPNPFSVSVSTTAPHTMVLGLHGSNAIYNASPGSGFIGYNQIGINGHDLASYNYSMYQIFNAPQTNYTATMVADAFGGVIFDALRLT